MKNIFYVILGVYFCLVPLVAEELKKPPEKEAKSNSNNIKFGLFFSPSINWGYTNDLIRTDKNVLTYDSEGKNKNSGYTSFDGGGIEGKVGIIKTFSVIGIRAYGYAGASLLGTSTTSQYKSAKEDENEKPDTYIKLDTNKESMNITKTYYGGMIDLMFGNFYEKKSGYFFLGMGYQITNYSLSGDIAFGDELDINTTKNNYYRTSIDSKEKLGNIVFNLGAGIFLARHHMFEFTAKFMKMPNFVYESTLNHKTINNDPFYSPTSVSPSDLKLNYPDKTPIVVKNTLSMDITFALSYTFIF